MKWLRKCSKARFINPLLIQLFKQFNMELTEDLIGIQGLFQSIEKSKKDCLKIRYKGGNEDKIQFVVNELKRFLISRGYTSDENEIKKENDKQISEIVTFLLINSEFKDPDALDIKELSHLVNIMPILSKCLLVNVAVELNLTEYYSRTIQRLPLNLSSDILKEMIPCLKRKDPDCVLKNTFIVVREIIKKLSGVDMSTYQVHESADQLSDIVSELLLPISGFNPENIQGWKKKNIYKHMGYTLLKLFKLIQYCQIENEALTRIIDKLVTATSCVIKFVTIDVYCVWAEIDHDGQALQMIVRFEAYHVLEKMSKYKKGTELVQMLGTMAAKPKTLQEVILESSQETIAKKIDTCDADQKHWFAALLNTQVFNNPAAIKSLKKWWMLCSAQDIHRVISLSRDYNTPEAKEIVLKCASNLSVNDLILTMSRFFRQYGLQNHLESDDVRQKLICQLNKSNIENKSENELNDDNIKQILLLLLQNPEVVIEILFVECIKNEIFTTWLSKVFAILKDILQIEMVGSRTLKKTLYNNDKLISYVNFINMLISTECCDCDNLYRQVFKPSIDEAFIDNLPNLKVTLILLNELDLQQNFNNNIKKEFSTLLMQILEKHRCSFTNFSNLNMEITISATSLLKKLQYLQECKEEYNPINKYYTNPNSTDYLSTIFSNFNVEDYGDAVGKLLQVISRCVPEEWLMISNELSLKFSLDKCVELLTDCLILTCKVTDTQNEVENPLPFVSLKYYLSNYGICIKHLHEKQQTEQFQKLLIKNIFRILRVLPQAVRQTEGVNLIPLLPVEIMKEMKTEKTFLSSLVALDPQLSKIIVKKIM